MGHYDGRGLVVPGECGDRLGFGTIYYAIGVRKSFRTGEIRTWIAD